MSDSPILGLLLSLAITSSIADAQSLFDRNLITNPGAESGAPASTTDDPPVPIPGWTSTGTMTVGTYGGNGFFDADNYGPRVRGSNYFVAKSEPALSTATQTINLSGAAAEVDAGRVRFHLGGYIGGTHMVKGGLRAVFLDASGRTLLESFAAAQSEDRFWGNGALLLCTTTGFLLPNTRSVRLVLELRATDSGFGWPGADNLEFRMALESVTGRNLIVNGDAETDDGEQNQNTAKPITGWNAPPGMMAFRYTALRLAEDTPLPENRGLNLFGEYSTNTTSAYQVLDLTLVKDLIDNGGLNYQLSGFLGGGEDSPDESRLTMDFLDATGSVISTTTVGPVTVSDRGSKTGLLKRTGEGSIPARTRQVRVTLWLHFKGEAYSGSYAYADNISLVLSSGAIPVRLTRIANSASAATGPVAPGEMVTLLTEGVTLDSVVRMQLDADGRVKTDLGGVRVFFDGTQAPILWVNSSQIGAVSPFDLDGKSTTQVRVEYKGQPSNTVSNAVSRTAPGVFTQEGSATGRGLIYGETWTLNSAANAAAKGSLVTILWTGGGQLNPSGVDGRIEMQSLPRVAANVAVSIGGQNAEVVYAGAVPYSWAGLLMVQAKVPSGAATGDAVPVVVTANGVASQQGVTMAVR